MSYWDGLNDKGRNHLRRYYRELRLMGFDRTRARMHIQAILFGLFMARYWTEQ